jgi:glycosyltransferase involved in cell wall biosynthesis
MLISACLIAYNEERVIERCLESLEGVVDEILVLHDGPCADATLAIAERHGATVSEEPRVGHMERHAVTAYARAKGDWILAIDADEFLSGELREQLRSLCERPDAPNGFELLWPRWDGTRYVSMRSPHKRCLFRRDKVHLAGYVHAPRIVDPPVERLDLLLEHRPLYNNFTLKVMLSKWRRWARIQASEMLTPLHEIPAYNLPADRAWPKRRQLFNRVAPLLLPLYALATFVVDFRKSLGPDTPPKEALQTAFYSTAYATMLQLYIGKLLYLKAPRRRPPIARSAGSSNDTPPT